MYSKIILNEISKDKSRIYEIYFFKFFKYNDEI